ncbi:hypothetical protein BH18ACI4_BH18ACI4_28380 [soil metagenome]
MNIKSTHEGYPRAPRFVKKLVVTPTKNDPRNHEASRNFLSVISCDFVDRCLVLLSNVGSNWQANPSQVDIPLPLRHNSFSTELA